MWRQLARVVAITVQWGLAWGLAGAAIGAVVTVFQPDTGHIPVNEMPLFIGAPSAMFGLVAGLLFALIAVATGKEIKAGRAGRMALGGVVGCAMGVVFMRVLAHSYVTVILATLLGVALGARLPRGAGAAR